jgi:hypothetical protein
VVAKAEFAQSYSAQPQMAFLSDSIPMAPCSVQAGFRFLYQKGVRCQVSVFEFLIPDT